MSGFTEMMPYWFHFYEMLILLCHGQLTSIQLINNIISLQSSFDFQSSVERHSRSLYITLADIKIDYRLALTYHADQIDFRRRLRQ